MIDFHCHLDLYVNPGLILNRLHIEKVFVLAVTTTPMAWRGTHQLVGDTPDVCVALGLHPQVVAERSSEIELLCSLMKETQFVGEIGLDGSEDYKESFTLQKDVLARALAACADHGGRIISLHSRRAAREVLDALECQPSCGTPVLHWFSGSQSELKRAVQLGCWFSVGPAMLRSERGKRLAGAMPPDRILTETDGPFTSSRTGPLMPWDVREAEEGLAALWRCELQSVRNTLAENLRRLVTHHSDVMVSARC